MQFEVYNTGGGCTAWRLDIPNTQLYVLVTQDLSHELDLSQPIEVGLYRSDADNSDDECIVFFTTMVNDLQIGGILCGSGS